MRQAGLKPKSHSSGTYWVRANASNKRGKGTEEETTHLKWDIDGDGQVKPWEVAVKWGCFGIGFFGYLIVGLIALTD